MDPKVEEKIPVAEVSPKPEGKVESPVEKATESPESAASFVEAEANGAVMEVKDFTANVSPELKAQADEVEKQILERLGQAKEEIATVTGGPSETNELAALESEMTEIHAKAMAPEAPKAESSTAMAARLLQRKSPAERRLMAEQNKDLEAADAGFSEAHAAATAPAAEAIKAKPTIAIGGEQTAAVVSEPEQAAKAAMESAVVARPMASVGGEQTATVISAPESAAKSERAGEPEVIATELEGAEADEVEKVAAEAEEIPIEIEEESPEEAQPDIGYQEAKMAGGDETEQAKTEAAKEAAEKETQEQEEMNEKIEKEFKAYTDVADRMHEAGDAEGLARILGEFDGAIDFQSLGLVKWKKDHPDPSMHTAEDALGFAMMKTFLDIQMARRERAGVQLELLKKKNEKSPDDPEVQRLEARIGSLDSELRSSIGAFEKMKSDCVKAKKDAEKQKAQAKTGGGESQEYGGEYYRPSEGTGQQKAKLPGAIDKIGDVVTGIGEWTIDKAFSPIDRFMSFATTGETKFLDEMTSWAQGLGRGSSKSKQKKAA